MAYAEYHHLQNQYFEVVVLSVSSLFGLSIEMIIYKLFYNIIVLHWYIE